MARSSGCRVNCTVFFSPGFKADTLKTAQVIVIHRNTAAFLFKVKLNYIIAFALAGIGNINGYGNIALLVFLLGDTCRLLIGKSGIA
ncbi:hypothetical protein [Mucilaginibacter sp.]|uniref:hypothetical protein n=1 Tax=Mucilaginibacter sp. TaxID=1882438 RepID=UPI003D14FC5D